MSNSSHIQVVIWSSVNIKILDLAALKMKVPALVSEEQAFQNSKSAKPNTLFNVWLIFWVNEKNFKPQTKFTTIGSPLPSHVLQLARQAED